MDAAQGDSHPPDRKRNRIVPRKDPAMGHADCSALINTERLEPLGLFRNQPRPINRNDAGTDFKRKQVKRHRPKPLPQRRAYCKSFAII